MELVEPRAETSHKRAVAHSTVCRWNMVEHRNGQVKAALGRSWRFDCGFLGRKHGQSMGRVAYCLRFHHSIPPRQGFVKQITRTNPMRIPLRLITSKAKSPLAAARGACCRPPSASHLLEARIRCSLDIGANAPGATQQRLWAGNHTEPLGYCLDASFWL